MELLSFALFLLSVIVISLSGVMIPGPVFAVTVAKGKRDRNAGAFIALGHGIIELPLMLAMYLGFTRVFESAILRDFISLAGGLMLIYMGTEMIKIRKEAYAGTKDVSYGSVSAGAVTTAANPYFFIWWATIGAALVMKASLFGLVGFIAFVIVHLSSDLAFDMLISTASFKSKELFSERVHEGIFAGCGALLLLFGFWFLSSLL